jgi:UDPglucose--hexose-1-phosphate uridylyltransferase
MTITFDKSQHETTILTPATGFKPQTQVVERRKDTLLDKWCRINVERANRPKTKGGDASVLELVENSRNTCPFCPDRIEANTPKFPESLVPGGRLRVGEAVALPNLFAFAQHHAVVVLTNTHYQPLDKYEAVNIRNGVAASIEYLRQVTTRYPKVRYASINWNNLPTAAASMIHPHFQVIADEAPTGYLHRTLKASKTYHEKNGTSYWRDIVETEKAKNERYIGDFGESHWYATYCGLGNNDVTGVVDASNLFEMTPKAIEDFSHGLVAILRGYHSISVQGFNLSIFSGPLDAHEESFRIHARIISRPDVKPLYTADAGFLERLHDEIVVETKPEDVAIKIRAVLC